MPTGRIDDHTRNALTTAQVDGRHVRLTTGQLTPAQYAPIKEVLENLGGHWSRSAQALIFPAGSDPAALIADVLTTGKVPLHARTAEGFVRTPAEVAEDLVAGYPWSEIDRLPAGARVLEPSAGDGAIVAAIHAANPDLTVVAVEPNEQRADRINTTGKVEYVASTLEDYAATGPGLFDAVVMNPPFTVPGKPTLWIDHVRLAYDLLVPGAMLTAIVPHGFRFRTSKQHRAVRDLVEAYGGHEDLPADAFKPSGTLIGTSVLWLRKPLDGPAAVDPHLFRQYDGTEVPTRVNAPRLTAEAITAAPVQVYWDAWRHADRVLRYQAQCVLCHWPLWGFEDGENDCRGILGDYSAGFSLDPFEWDLVGRSVGLCPMCANDSRESHLKAVEIARQGWSALPESEPEPEPAPAPVPIVPLPALAEAEQLSLFDQVGVAA